MKTKKYIKSESLCFKIINKKNKHLEGVFPFSTAGKVKAGCFLKSKGGDYKIIKSKI